MEKIASSLMSGLEIMKAFHSGDSSLGNSELSSKTGLPKSTVARLTQTLTSLGYLRQDRSLGPYQLGDKVFALGHRFLASLPICSIASPLLHDFAITHECSVSLAVGHESFMIHILHHDGSADGGSSARKGSMLPIATSVIGHAYWCGLMPDERAKRIKQLEGQLGTPDRTLLRGLEGSLESYAKRGYCAGINGCAVDTQTVAVPLTLNRDSVTLALGCSSRVQTIPLKRFVDKVHVQLAGLTRSVASTMQTLGHTFWDD